MILSVLYLVRPGIMQESIPLAAAIFLYSPILLGRVWLAWSKLFKNPSSMAVILNAIGTLSFLASDSYLSLNRFYTTLPYHQEIVMVTYYLAQAATTLTLLYQPKRENKKKK